MLLISLKQRDIQVALRTAVFLVKVLPMLPSRALNYVTPAPVVEKLEYVTKSGTAIGDVYRPAGRGPHPGIVVCLGVVPFGVDHPQVPRLGEALARAGLAALLYWSPHMRDFRLDPEDIENIALAYERLIEQPYVDAARSGLLGTCVGGAFALMGAASPVIRDRVRFVAAFAPYGSLLTLTHDVASSSYEREGMRYAWEVDPLTRKVLVHSVTARLRPDEAERIRAACEDGGVLEDTAGLSAEGQAVHDLLSAESEAAVAGAMAKLPHEVLDGLRDLSPINYLDGLQAPLIAISHDRDDTVIPVGESRRLKAALAGREGVTYTEFAMFQHADPTKRNLPPQELLRQLWRFYAWLHAAFRGTA